MLRKLDVFGNPYVGVFCRANENIAIVPPMMERDYKEAISESLGVEIVEMSIDSSILLGSMTAMNSRCAIVSYRSSEAEVAELAKHIKVIRIPHKLNAVGNNILVNDKGALLHDGMDKKVADLVAREMDVEVKLGAIAGIKTVGATSVVTNKGLLCHPRATETERNELRALFGVPTQIATANYGTALVGACMTANSRGCIVGSTSTPIELGRIEDGLFL